MRVAAPIETRRRAAANRVRDLRAGVLVLFSTVALLVVPSVPTQAQPTRKPAPKRAPSAGSLHSPPDTTATVPTTGRIPPKPPQKRVAAALAALPSPAAPDTDPLPPPFDLPPASRARVRACGLQWADIKMKGDAKDMIWREFAVKCFSAKADPEPSRGNSPKDAAPKP